MGNPLYHWSHLELQRFFGYHGILNGETAEDVWKLCNARLQEDSMSVRNLIRQSAVTLICTTDDPADDLRWHKALAEDRSFEVQVLPAWRPDKAMNMEKPDYTSYIEKLGAAAEMEIRSFAELKAALKKRMDFFESYGCKASDHALEYVMYVPEICDIMLPSLAVVPLQLFAYYVSSMKGCDIDKPRNLAKSVTVE